MSTQSNASTSSGSEITLLSIEPELPEATKEEKSIDTQTLESQTCKECGKEIQEPEMKDIPSSGAWLIFGFLFVCCFWWLSWIPFIVGGFNFCKTSVPVCPHCYRRIDRDNFNTI